MYTTTVINQRTNPAELPIFGDPFQEIALELIFPKGNQIFLLNGKSLQLLQPLDRDAENLSHIIFQVNIKHILQHLQMQAQHCSYCTLLWLRQNCDCETKYLSWNCSISQVSCTIRSTRRKRNIPVIVRVSDINDNAPVFQNTPYETTVPEVTTLFSIFHCLFVFILLCTTNYHSKFYAASELIYSLCF